MKGSIRRLAGPWLAVVTGMTLPACNRAPSDAAIPVMKPITQTQRQ